MLLGVLGVRHDPETGLYAEKMAMMVHKLRRDTGGFAVCSIVSAVRMRQSVCGNISQWNYNTAYNVASS